MNNKQWKETYRTKIEGESIVITRMSDSKSIVIPFEEVAGAESVIASKDWNRAARAEALRQAKACDSTCWG